MPLKSSTWIAVAELHACCNGCQSYGKLGNRQTAAATATAGKHATCAVPTHYARQPNMAPLWQQSTLFGTKQCGHAPAFDGPDAFLMPYVQMSMYSRTHRVAVAPSVALSASDDDQQPLPGIQATSSRLTNLHDPTFTHQINRRLTCDADTQVRHCT